MSAQNPKKVVDAACAGEVTVAGITLRPFVLGLFPVLQKIDSPLLSDGGAKREMKTEDIMRLVLCLTIPAAEARRLIAQGIEAFDEAALIAADRIPILALPELGLAIQRQFSKAVAPAPSPEGSATSKASAPTADLIESRGEVGANSGNNSPAPESGTTDPATAGI